jgi:putative hydrolase of the HAD superfamily
VHSVPEVRADPRAPPLQKPELLLLDAGNTLVFLDHAALAEAARCAHVAVSAEALARAEPAAKRLYEAAMTQGRSHEDGWLLHMRAIYECAGVPRPEAERAAQAAQAAHDAFNLWRRVPPGLEACLARLQRAGIRLGVVSNSEGQLAALLERVGLAGYFEHVLDSGVEGVRKPDPEIFRRALARFGIPASRALYAGDIPAVDVGGARAAGMDAVLIDPFAHYPEYREARRFDSVMALADALGA